MSLRLNFCRSVPPEFLRSFFVYLFICFSFTLVWLRELADDTASWPIPHHYNVFFFIQFVYLFICLYFCFSSVCLLIGLTYSSWQIKLQLGQFLIIVLFVFVFVCLSVCLFILLLFFIELADETASWTILIIVMFFLYIFLCLFVYFFICFWCIGLTSSQLSYSFVHFCCVLIFVCSF